MRWTSLAQLADLPEHLNELMRGEAPPTYEVLHPAEIVSRSRETVESARELGALVVETPSGLPAVWADIEADVDFSSLERIVNELAAELDLREWTSPENEVDVPQHVHHDIHTRIDDLDVVGPGGRLTKSMVGSLAIFGLSIHPRGQPILAPWRDGDRVARGIMSRLETLPSNPEFRTCFGFFERSSSEVTTHIRPVIVTVAEGGETQEYRWRVTLVEPLTESLELPPGMGLEGIVGACT